MSDEEEFTAQIVSNNRVTVPRKIMRLLQLKEGDFVKIKLRKRTKQ